VTEELQGQAEVAGADRYYSAIAAQGVNLYMLPEAQQRLLDWLGQQEFASLTDISTYLDLDRATTASWMETLTNQGFVQSAHPSLVPASTVTLSRQRQAIADTEGADLAAGKPLAFSISPSGDHSAVAGDSFEVSVTVFNRGDRSALVDVFLDQTAQVRQWCADPSERLALAAGQSNEVLFRFQVPPQTLPATYAYQLVIDSSQHYPEDTPIQISKRLQILPRSGTAVQVKDPTLTLQPVTRSTQPVLLQPGATLEVQVQVHNRSDRVDRFRLTCPDLRREWYTIRYPSGIETPGLITSGQELKLNPNGKGEILLSITPPLETPAGRYSPTIRLYSSNNPALNLLDVVYVQVAALYQLTAELQTLVSKVRRSPASYRLHLHNGGNTRRNLLLSVSSVDEEDAPLYDCTWEGQKKRSRQSGIGNWESAIGNRQSAIGNWESAIGNRESTVGNRESAIGNRQSTVGNRESTVGNRQSATDNRQSAIGNQESVDSAAFPEPHPLQILPRQSADLGLQIQPIKPWRRPWFGSGRVSTFRITLEDAQDLPLQTEPIQAILIWKARPWWQFLLLLLAGLGLAGALIYLLWWMFLRQPDPPVILEFAAEEPTYQEAAASPVRLSWQISNPARIRSLRLLGRSRQDDAILSSPVVYDFSRGIPRPLEPFCTRTSALTCRNVPTDAQKSGNYVFELRLDHGGRFWDRRKLAPLIATTNTVRVEGTPIPKVVQFTSAIASPNNLSADQQTAVQAQIGDNVGVNPERTIVLHSWRISHPEQIHALELVSRDRDGAVNRDVQRYSWENGVPRALRPFCSLTQELVCVNVPTVIYRAGEYGFELSTLAKETPTTPADSKKADTLKIEPPPPRILAFQLNGQEALPKYLVPIRAGNPIRAIALSWKVQPGRDVKVELLPTPGSVPFEGSLTYPLAQQPGSFTLSLQVTNAAGKQVRRAIEFQVFDPSLGTPPPAAAVRPAHPPSSPMPPVPASPRPAGSPSPMPSPTGLPIPLPRGGSPAPVEVPPRFNP